ncbi:MAG: archaellin/type IV pilin N-terminal domain-containing protein, partial [Candidatus Kariarchaeaceae archaeon]
MNRKGVSTYISVLLLIVVVIAGGILIYGYTMGWFGRLGGEGEMGMVSLDSAYADSTN